MLSDEALVVFLLTYLYFDKIAQLINLVWELHQLTVTSYF